MSEKHTVPYSSIVIGWEAFSSFLIGSEEKPFESHGTIRFPIIQNTLYNNNVWRTVTIKWLPIDHSLYDVTSCDIYHYY
jgi:hypothetical protein